MRCSTRTGRLTSTGSCLEEVRRCQYYVEWPADQLDTNEDADHRYMMFSATFNKACRQLARKYLAADHIRIRIGRPGSCHINVDQAVSTVFQ